MLLKKMYINVFAVKYVRLLVIISLSSILFVAIEQESFAAETDVLAKVGNKTFTKKEWNTKVDLLVKEGYDRQVLIKNYKSIIEDIFVYPVLLEEEYKKLKLRESREYRTYLANEEKRILIQLYQKYVSGDLLNEANLKREYKLFVKEPVIRLELNLRHILVDTKSEAIEIIKKLEAGEKFADLARKRSLDTNSAVKGGDLGFINSSRFVAPFVQGAYLLEDGKYSKVPVQTKFGFHIINRISSRPVTKLPTIEQAKDVLINKIVTKALGKKLQSLKRNAKIEVFSLK